MTERGVAHSQDDWGRSGWSGWGLISQRKDREEQESERAGNRAPLLEMDPGLPW